MPTLWEGLSLNVAALQFGRKVSRRIRFREGILSLSYLSNIGYSVDIFEIKITQIYSKMLLKLFLSGFILI